MVEELIDKVIDQIIDDVENRDISATHELFSKLIKLDSNKAIPLLKGFLPEESKW
jgi:hypothetical protein